MDTREKLFAAFLTLVAVITICGAAFGQVVPPGGNSVVQFNNGRVGYQLDTNGNSTTLYDMGNGMTGYTSENSSGRITSQGTLYQANPRSSVIEPLYAPIGGSRTTNSIGMPLSPGTSAYEGYSPR